MLKYLGLLAIFVACVMPAVEYGARHRRRMSEYGFFIRLCDDVHEQIASYMRPIGDLLSEYDTSALGDVPLNFSGYDFSSGFSSAKGALSISGAAVEALSSFFDALGGSVRRVELRRVSELKRILVSEREGEMRSAEKSIGAIRAVCCAVGLTLVILLI